MITEEEFLNIRAELDSLTGDARSKTAIAYLDKYNLSKEIPDSTLLSWYKNGTTIENWQHAYLLERSIPYYKNSNPQWQQRLLYFPGTAIFENYLDHKTLGFNNQNYVLRFTRGSGRHDVVEAGYGAAVPDFYIWEDGRAIMVEFKFANYKKFKTYKDVYRYYNIGGNGYTHMHNAKILLVFLEAENTFYLIDYANTKIYRYPALQAPTNYIGTDEIASFTDPLK